MIRGLLGRLLRTQPDAVDRRAEKRRLSIAVFIDADGVSPRDADIVLDHLRCVGEVATIRWFGNQSAGQAPAWTPLIRKHGVFVRHMPALVPGKNASDVALVVDVMDHLQTRSADIYALVASDSDFTPLALRLREGRKTVLGFGSSSTPSAFRASCTAFEEIRAIDPMHVKESRKRALFWTMQPSDAEGLIVRVLLELGGEHTEVSLDQLAKRLAIEGDHGFDARIYRRRNLTELLSDLPAVHLVIEDGSRAVRLANDPGGMADIFGIRGQDHGNIEVLEEPRRFDGDAACAHQRLPIKPPLLGLRSYATSRGSQPTCQPGGKSVNLPVNLRPETVNQLAPDAHRNAPKSPLWLTQVDVGLHFGGDFGFFAKVSTCSRNWRRRETLMPQCVTLKHDLPSRNSSDMFPRGRFKRWLRGLKALP